MTYLKDKIVKTKRLQRLSKNSLVVILPNNWIEEMGWDRKTNLKVSWHADRDEIIISKSEVKDPREEVEEEIETEIPEIEI